MKREFRRWGGVGALLVAASPCYAADADDGLDSLPVVLSASRLRQPVDEAPAPVTVIDRQMIEASGFRTIPDLLRLVPGFLVGYINGNTASVTNQGLADAYSRQMQVLIDGRSIYSPLFGGVYWNDIPITLGDIERIEVVRGPNAASFGANSFLGVINIITKEPGAEQGSHLEWITGSDGVSQLTYRQAGGSGDWRYRGTVSQDLDHGFAGIDDSQRTERANFRGEYQLNEVDQIQFQMGYAGGTRGEATKNYGVETPSNRGVNSGFAQIRWTRRNSTDDETWIQYSHDQRSASEKAVIPIGGLIGDYVISSDMDTRRDDLEA